MIDMEALQVASKQFAPHEFTPNALHPYVCAECGREKANAKYHVQASNAVSLSAVSPDRWDGELTEDKLKQIVSGLLIPNHAMSCRLAFELLKTK